MLELSSEFYDVSRLWTCNYYYFCLPPAIRDARFDMLVLLLFGDFTDFFVISDSSLAEVTERGDC